MRTALWMMAVVVPVASAAAFGVGCGFLPDDCKERFACAPGSTGGGATSTTGTGGGTPAGCVPHDNKDPVADTCGVFVSSSKGMDGADAGSKTKPFKTLGAAVKAAAGKQPVYACAETYTEALALASDVKIYGGLDCAKAWVYSGTKAKLTAAPDAVPLAVSAAATGAGLFDFTVQAADAMKDGGSSIAVIVEQADFGLTRCDLVAGDGAAGLPGTTPTEDVGPTLDKSDPAIKGEDGGDACSSQTKVSGGLPKDNALCPAVMGGPLGGPGGDGFPTLGNSGGSIPATPETALGGIGQATGDLTLNCAVGQGTAGIDGADGTAGAGATGVMSLGTISASGYTGVAGKSGDVGKPGQGGGGGGGAKGKANCAGASGGGGGAGGCGGPGGTGGMPGGASIALVSVGATLTFEAVKIQVGTGGYGGDGGDGEGGGIGGKGGAGGLGAPVAPVTSGGCDGGNGGKGGSGGKGGGGRGGHAIGIASSGAMTSSTKGVVFTKGTPGAGGKGGMTGNGDDGVLADVQAFP